MKTLIAPTDFSKTSLNAVNYAADMAVSINARLEILHAMQVPIATGIPDYISQLQEEMQEEQYHKLQLLKQRLEKRTASHIPVACHITEGGTNSVIKDFAEKKKPFALILGSKGVSNIQKIVFGSIALHTAKHVGSPVLLVPEKAKFTPVSAIAFATDLLLESSNQLIKDLRKWLSLFNARLDIVHVNENALFKNDKEKQFLSFKKHFSHNAVHFNYVVSDSIPAGISSYIKINKPGMLVIAYHKESFLHRLVYRSDFGNIFRGASIPLLVFPANN